MKRTILAYLEIDDDLAFEKIDDGPIAYLEKESGWLAQSGIFITDAAIADADAADPKEAYLVYLARFAFDHLGDEVKTMSPLKSVLCIAGGLAAIIVGGDLVVDSAFDIAAAFGMSEALIGLTIVAVGTSLPELVTSIVAAKKGDSGLALGNVVGSNIFNILFILGSASALSTINVAPELFIDTAILIGVTLMMYFLCRSKDKTSRGEGALCVLVYAAYMAYIILR